MKLLDIKGSTVTTDAVGTQTQIMEQIFSQEGHILLMVKKNQPQSET
ncbi:transposase family protein [bacterium 1xD8-48]|nr:transposase family protein [bacterium 1xD8-48]